MKVIAYLGFTVLSIFIQFCVMDFIQDRSQDNNIKSHYLNGTSQKKELRDLIKDISSKPHALYYRTLVTRSLKKSNLMIGNTSTYNNATQYEVISTTDVPVPVVDILYDENTSVTGTLYTTEPFTSTEFDNITEITFIDKKNTSLNTPKDKPKPQFSKDCTCNFLYQACDINCCCDIDCTDYEHKLFNCDEHGKSATQTDHCNSLWGDHRYGNTLFDSLFCVVKTNLPDKHTVKKYDQIKLQNYYKWHNIERPKPSYEFRKTLYKRNDPIWLLNNQTFYYMDMATPLINNYCSARTPMKFLKDEKIKCNVKINDLEMFHILRTSEEAKIVSSTEKTLNTTVLNCSNLHCINWTILACYDDQCTNYDKSLNEASCTEHNCTNLAFKIDYNFYYYDSKIINATIKLYIQNISFMLPLMTQEMNVKFFIANKSEDRIITFSGSPGYIEDRPIIASYHESNYTDYFYNSTTNKENYLFVPDNINGICSLYNASSNAVKFGINKRTKCRYIYSNKSDNNSNVCNTIQNDINELIGLNNKVAISPLGNPYGVADEDWLKFHIDMNPELLVYGEYNEDTSKLYCRNLVTAISLKFFSVNEDQRRISKVDYEVIAKNASFNIEDISTVITTDVNFIDLSKPNTEYAAGPHLNIHLPKDFFFPAPPSNKCFQDYDTCVKSLNMLCLTCIVFLSNKITLE